MNDDAVISADYVDLKFIKSRKVCQIVVEIDIDHAQKFVAAFGTPNPATGVPVALARIDPNAKAEPERKGGKLAQLAGIICQEAPFAAFMKEKYSELMPCEPAEFIRHMCGVLSRAELDHHESAGRRFKDLKLEYEAWMSVAA